MQLSHISILNSLPKSKQVYDECFRLKFYYELILYVRQGGSLSEGFLGHDVVEILTGNLSTVRCSSLKHFLKLLDVHCFSEFLSDAADIVGVDCSGVIVIEEIKDLVDSGLSNI